MTASPYIVEWRDCPFWHRPKTQKHTGLKFLSLRVETTSEKSRFERPSLARNRRLRWIRWNENESKTKVFSQREWKIIFQRLAGKASTQSRNESDLQQWGCEIQSVHISMIYTWFLLCILIEIFIALTTKFERAQASPWWKRFDLTLWMGCISTKQCEKSTKSEMRICWNAARVETETYGNVIGSGWTLGFSRVSPLREPRQRMTRDCGSYVRATCTSLIDGGFVCLRATVSPSLAVVFMSFRPFVMCFIIVWGLFTAFGHWRKWESIVNYPMKPLHMHQTAFWRASSWECRKVVKSDRFFKNRDRIFIWATLHESNPIYKIILSTFLKRLLFFKWKKQ